MLLHSDTAEIKIERQKLREKKRMGGRSRDKGEDME